MQYKFKDGDKIEIVKGKMGWQWHVRPAEGGIAAPENPMKRYDNLADAASDVARAFASPEK